MKIYHGFIKEISEVDPDRTGHQKQKVVIEEPGNQLTQIEFNGTVKLNLLQGIKIHDQVIIAASNKGSRSRNSGKFHNNVIAKTLKKA